jgi:uncharacterized protein (DUF1330 family)
MRYYAIARIDVEDSAWVREYVTAVTPMVERHGGRYLARTAQIERFEGERDRPQIAMVIEWSSKAAAEQFYESDEYRPYRERRRAGSRSDFLLVAGEDVNGIARIAA